MSELLPCPFCGGEAAIVPTLDTTVREWFVTCGNLECNVLACRTKRYYTEAKAIAAWNSRADYHGYEQAAIEAWESIKAWNSRAERTCHIEWRDDSYDTDAGYERDGAYFCTACGADLPYPLQECWDDYQAGNYEKPFDHCPNCGRKCI